MAPTAADSANPPLAPATGTDAIAPRGSLAMFAPIALAAFALYWASALALQARGATTHFGADAHVYSLLAKGVAIDGLTRFHPVTIGMGLAWMKLTAPLAALLAPATLLKAMFAAIGAIGVWAALSAFATVMPRRTAVLFGLVYALSVGVWYCSSIEESKIVTATLSALYIAVYLRLRESWTPRGALLLTAILLAACLNEIVAVFLVAIPAVDTLAQRGLDLRQGRWIAAHALAGPLAFAILELGVNGLLLAPDTATVRSSHWTMLVTYVTHNHLTAATLYDFLVPWLLFNIAAPTTDATAGVDLALNFAGTFAPLPGSYLSSPVSSEVATFACAVVLASVLPGRRRAGAGTATSAVSALVLALLAYALLRGAFYFAYLPNEPLLNSAASTLPHLLLIGIAFAASRFRAKRTLLAVFAALLFVANGAFVFGYTQPANLTVSPEIEAAIEALGEVEESEATFRTYCRLADDLAAARADPAKAEDTVEQIDDLLGTLGPQVLIAGYLSRVVDPASANGRAMERALTAMEARCPPK